MENSLFSSLFLSQNPQIYVAAFLTAIVTFLPRLVAALLVFFLGRILANWLASTLSKIIDAIDLKKLVDSFELGLSLPAQSQRGLAQLASVAVRYTILFITLILVFDVLGLSGVALFLKNFAQILPKAFSAIFIIILGLIAAGVIESLVKKAFLEIDPATARLAGKISSYVVITFFVLMSLAEVGLASFFINTLFVGFVAAISLALGLSIGLGSKDIVSQTLSKWYTTKSKKK